jgi:CRP-like cAMP-binding protein
MRLDSTIRDELHHVYLFGALNDEQLTRVAETTREVHLSSKQTLFESMQPAERFFLLRKGQIKLFAVSSTGCENVLEIVQPQQTFAEAVMFMEQHRYPVSAEAIEDSELFGFDMRVYRRILEESPETCFRLLAGMSRRLHGRINEINNLTLQNATYRLIYFLLQQLPEGAVQLPQIHLSTPKSVIAARLSIQPETLSRTLHKLSEKGLISVQANEITLLDIDGLRALL